MNAKRHCLPANKQFCSFHGSLVQFTSTSRKTLLKQLRKQSLISINAFEQNFLRILEAALKQMFQERNVRSRARYTRCFVNGSGYRAANAPLCSKLRSCNRFGNITKCIAVDALIKYQSIRYWRNDSYRKKSFWIQVLLRGFTLKGNRNLQFTVLP